MHSYPNCIECKNGCEVAFGRTIKTTSKANDKKTILAEALVGDKTGFVYLNLWYKQKIVYAYA